VEQLTIWGYWFGACSEREEVPSDFHVFLHLKTFLGCQWVHIDSEVKEDINM
jgi:hypothetical protein